MKKRNQKGFSLLELISTIVVLAIVISLLYSYENRGWEYFYNSYGRGLSHLKAKLAIKTISEDLREANRSRVVVGKGAEYNIPFPNDAFYNSPYIYFTKPKLHVESGNVIGYDYVLYYFAVPKEDLLKRGKIKQENYLILRCIRFTDQSKFYTEENEYEWPFMPPVIAKYDSELEEDRILKDKLNSDYAAMDQNSETILETKPEEPVYLDLYDKVSAVKRNIQITSDFITNNLTDPFSKEDVNFYFERTTNKDTPIKISVSIKEKTILLGAKTPPFSFETNIIPRN